MNRNWNDFKSIYGNLSGAREAFEDACETLFRKKFSPLHVSQVKVKNGDGGIDIFVGELGVDPITVIQCKFFLESFDKSQHSQIRESFKTAINSENYELKEWILCIPRTIDIDENAWWFKWKHRQIKEHSKKIDFIKLINGNEIIDLLKELNLYNQIFKIEDSLRIEELYKHLIPNKQTTPIDITPSLVLFNNYSSKNEPYYLERNTDTEFVQALEIGNIWLYGKSGFGKTALINRNLIQNSVQYCFCDLSPVTINNEQDVLDEILVTLEDLFECSRKASETNVIKQICNILFLQKTKNTVIVIDELSVPNEDILKGIANNFIQLVTHYKNKTDRGNLKFVVSTIKDPKKIIGNKSKASEYFHYMCCNSWEAYSYSLFDLLTKSLNLDLASSKKEIIEKSKNSPRTIKNIIKKIIVMNETGPENVTKAVSLTLEEIV